MILLLEQDMQFWSGGYFTFSGYTMQKQIAPIDAVCIPGPETTKIQKSPKINLCKNSAAATKWCESTELYIFIPIWVNLIECQGHGYISWNKS